MRRLGLRLALGLPLLLAGCANKAAVAPTTSPDPAGGPTAIAAADDPGYADAEQNRSWIAAATASDYMLIGQSEQTFGVWVDVPKAAGGTHVPTSLTLAIDTSGSMRGDKIIHARDAARRLIAELEEGDRVSIVTFSDRGRVLVAPTMLTEDSRHHMNNVVEELGANGGTAMHEGLRVAEAQMWDTPDTHLVRRLVVVSDGKATVGPTSPDELGRLAEVGLQQGIQVTSIGVGVEYDELTLNELAVRSSGRLYHVEHSQQLPGIIEEEIALLESTAAADVAVELVAAPGVEIVGTDVAHSQWNEGALTVPIGTMFAGQRRELLVRARVRGDGTEGSKVLASVRLHFRDPAEDGLRRVQESIVRAIMTDDPSLVVAHENSRTQTLMAMREASVMTQQASRQLSAGDLDRADLELAKAEERLEQQAARASTPAEKRQVERSAKKVRASRVGIRRAKAKPKAAQKEDSRRISLEANDAAMEDLGY